MSSHQLKQNKINKITHLALVELMPKCLISIITLYANNIDDEIQKQKKLLVDKLHNLWLKYEPNEMYHPQPENGWDEWENEKYDVEFKNSRVYYSQAISKLLRNDKLKRMREINPLYCNKTKRNKKNYHYC